jgi:hypothetical protein
MTHLESLKINAPQTITYIEDYKNEQHQITLLNSFGLPIGVSCPMDLVFNVGNLSTVDDDTLEALIALEYDEPEDNKVTLFADAERLCTLPRGYIHYCNYIKKLDLIKEVLKGKELPH